MNFKKSISFDKIFLVIPVILMVILFDCCTKSDAPKQSVNMSGNFDLVSDSIHNMTQVVTIYSYKGQSADYWNFKSDSLYTKEGQQLDSLCIRVSRDSLFIGGIPFSVSSESGGNIRLQNIKPDIDFGGDYYRIILLHPSPSNSGF